MAKARRAKKSKAPKKLLIVPVVLMGAWAVTLGMNAKVDKIDFKASLGSEVRTYEASDFVKDVFTQNDIKYLPIVYKDPYEQITKADIEEEFRKAGNPVKEFSTETIGTGTQIVTQNATYTVLIYGDIDGNGQINVRDVQAIVKHLLYGNGQELTGIKRMAANVENEKNEAINVRDAQRIVQFIIGKKGIIDSVPTSDILNDKEAPVIRLKGNEEVTVRVFDEYHDEGADVTDNLDPNIASKLVVDTSKVDTNKPGDYEVTYNAKDASGNNAQTVKRIVHVVDYVSDIEIVSKPNTEFIDGEPISLDGIIAYAINRYSGKDVTPIPTEELSLSEDTPNIANLEMTEIKIVYKGIEKTIKITVTEKRPKITLTGHDGKTDLILKVGDTYIEGATAWDDTDNKAYRVTWEGTVNTNIPGTYEVKYKSEPNSLGKVGELTRTVTVVDYIEDVLFRLDESKFKDKYVDGETISKEGVKAYAIWKYESHKQNGQIQQIEITEPLDCDTDVVRYDRNRPSNNIGRKIVFSYTVIDEVMGTSKTYTSDKYINTEIDVLKKLETIETETQSGIKDEGDMYDYMWVARIKSGVNEESIDINRITYSLANPDADKDGFESRVWVEQAYRKDEKGKYILDSNNNKIPVEGYLDVYFVGVGEDKVYTINLRPIGDSEFIQTTQIHVKTKINTSLNWIDIGELEDIDGNPVTRFKAGETVYAKLKFYHRYGKEGEAGLHDVEIANVAAGSLDRVFVDNTDALPISGITGEFVDINNNVVSNTQGATAFVKRIKLTANKGVTDVEKNVRIMITPNGADNAFMKPIKIYPESKYSLELGKVDSINIEEPITLSLKALTRTEYRDYEVKNVDGNYYTILPINVHDQWEDKDIYYSDLSTDYKEKDKGKIVFYDHIDATGETSYIDLIGIDINGNVVKDEKSKVALAYVGIGISNARDNINEEDELEGKTITVFFENKEAKKFTPITIVRQAVSNIVYKSRSESVVSECYEYKDIAVVTSGPRQEAIRNKGLIECSINKQIKNAAGQTVSTPVEDGSAECTTSINADGEVTINFFAKNAGTYEVIPKLRVNGTLVPVVVGSGENQAVVVTVSENTEVNKVVFENEIGNPEPEGSFGDAAIGAKQRHKIKYYHVYKDGNIVLGQKEIKNIDHELIELTTNIAGDKDYSGELMVNKMSSSSVIPDGATGLVGANVDEIRVIVKDTVQYVQGKQVKFKITIYKDDTKNVKTYENTITVDVEPKLKIDGLKVGWKQGVTEEDINLYVTEAGLSNSNGDKVVKYDKSYYTLVPISFVSGTKEVLSSELNMKNIKAEIGVKTEPGKITFIDNVNSDSPDYGGASIIDIQGFVEGSDVPVSPTSTTPIDYIGIAVPEDNQVFLNDSFEGEDNWVQLAAIKVYYMPSDVGADLKTSYTLNIKAPDFTKTVQAKSKMRARTKNIEPIKVNEENIKDIKYIDPNE